MPIRDAGRLDPRLLRLVVISDGVGDLVRLERLVTAAVDGGARCVQLREPSWCARELFHAAERLRPRLDAVGGILLVNDRVDVALLGAAHGVQIGQRSLPAARVRRLLGPEPVIGFSAHGADELELADAAGCDFALLSPVFPTSSKPGQPALGVERAVAEARRARLPIVWLGGIDTDTVRAVATLPAAARPAGVAVRSAIADAAHPDVMATTLLHGLGGA
ncbi:MAG: thiamine phosphate synthase [Planctomycetota bacterium]